MFNRTPAKPSLMQILPHIIVPMVAKIGLMAWFRRELRKHIHARNL